MKASRILLALALAAGTGTALAAPGDPAGNTGSAWMSIRNDAVPNGVEFVLQNETAKRQLEALGFPQYAD
jgi:hypothetical protein